MITKPARHCCLGGKRIRRVIGPASVRWCLCIALMGLCRCWPHVISRPRSAWLSFDCQHELLSGSFFFSFAPFRSVERGGGRGWGVSGQSGKSTCCAQDCRHRSSLRYFCNGIVLGILWLVFCLFPPQTDWSFGPFPGSPTGFVLALCMHPDWSFWWFPNSPTGLSGRFQTARLVFLAVSKQPNWSFWPFPNSPTGLSGRFLTSRLVFLTVSKQPDWSSWPFPNSPTGLSGRFQTVRPVFLAVC